MAFNNGLYCALFGSLMFSVAASSCLEEDHYIGSRATNYPTPDGLGTPYGACGLKEYGRIINNGEVSAVSNLYMGGRGCGTCYQVRCKDPRYCNKVGTKVVVTDHGGGDNTDFILSHRAYAHLATWRGAAEHLFAAGVVEVEYKRVYCGLPGFGNNNLFVKFAEETKFPYYIALLVLYEGLDLYVQEVSVGLPGQDVYYPMRRAYGAVWDIANHPIDGPPLVLVVKLTGETGLRLPLLQNATSTSSVQMMYILN